MTLTEFLLARIAEDEAVARESTPGPWTRAFTEDTGYAVRRGEHETVALYAHWDEADHIARHDPARVLAECEAKRALVADIAAEKHEVVDDCWYTCGAATEDRDGGETCNDSTRGGGCDCGRDSRVERRLRILALPYADHEDYDESWRP